MTNKDLANLMFPDISMTVEDYKKKYPTRKLKEGAIVSRYAPSPTGFVHMGNIYAAFIERKFAKQTDGVFFLRIEDTDKKRYVEDGIERILTDMKNFHIEFDECPFNMNEEKGNYGPYIQSQRNFIYKAFVKHFIELGLAYPCFCKEEDLEKIRKKQETNKDRIGYYGKWALCRNIPIDEAYKLIKNGEKFIVRLKSNGDFNKKIKFHDLVKGDVELPENDLDIVILKSDGLPTYHFAHLVDDYLMGTTHVIRDHNWFSSLPVHIQLFQMLGVNSPKYAHIAPVMKLEDGSLRKLSKRKDPEAAVSYYHEKGIPVDAVMIYIATISNSNFEAWYDNNSDKSVNDFELSFNKISKSGPLFDVEKLNNISKNYISKMTAKEVYDNLYKWACEFDNGLKQILEKYKDYSIDILNIEREQTKPRKDFSCYSEITNYIWYMFDEYFKDNKNEYEWQSINDKKEISIILDTYIKKYFDINDDKETWFNKLKLLCDDLGYASEMKEYKNNPDKYKGNIADISLVIRIALTTKSMTPDLYETMKLLGKDRIISRFNKFI